MAASALETARTTSGRPRSSERRALDPTELVAIAILVAALLGFASVIVFTSIAITPEDIELGRVVLGAPCPHKARYGIECLTCGLTRGFSAAAHGQFAVAWGYNRAAPVLFLLACCLALGSATVLYLSLQRLLEHRSRGGAG